jgi:hypothetical protein
MMHLMIGKLPLVSCRDGSLGYRHPAADTFALLAEQLAGARTVTRRETSDRPALHAFEVDRGEHGPPLVLWEHRDALDGEDEPPVTITWPWPAVTEQSRSAGSVPPVQGATQGTAQGTARHAEAAA